MKSYPKPQQSTQCYGNKMTTNIPLTSIGAKEEEEEPEHYNNINTMCQRLEQLTSGCLASTDALESTISGILSASEPAKPVGNDAIPETSPLYDHLMRIGLTLNTLNERINNIRRRSTL